MQENKGGRLHLYFFLWVAGADLHSCKFVVAEGPAAAAACLLLIFLFFKFFLLLPDELDKESD